MDDLLIKAHLDSNGQDMAIEHVQDVQDIVDWAKAARDVEQPSDWGRHTHRVPDVEIVKMLDEAAARGHHVQYLSKEFDELFKKKLKSGDWEIYRVDRPALMMGVLGFGS